MRAAFPFFTPLLLKMAYFQAKSLLD